MWFQCKQPRSDSQLQIKSRLILAEPPLEPTLPFLTCVHARLVLRLAQSTRHCRGRCPASWATPAGVRRRRRRGRVTHAVLIRTTPVPLIVLSLGALVQTLLLQGLLLQLVHGAVERARVRRLAVGIGVSRAGARHGGYIVVGTLIALLLVGILCFFAVTVVSALIGGHARVVTWSALSVLSVRVGICVLSLVCVRIDHAVWTRLGWATSVVTLVRIPAIHITVLTCRG